MSFYGDTIIFGGISCTEFGLMLVGKLNNEAQESGPLGTRVSVIEDTILRRPSPVYYAAKQNEPLEFKLVLSVMEDNQSLSRHDLAAIAGWLYGHYDYQELVICQEDLADYFYKCKAVELEPVFIAGKAVGITVSMRCDAPFAYMRTADDVMESTGAASYTYHNRSNMNGCYFPVLSIAATGGSSSAELLNRDGNQPAFVIRDIPASGAVITIDCLRQIITSDVMNDVYDHCNLKFPGFIKGGNRLQLTGSYTLTVTNEFPMYIGA